jgi:hypothetical protein
LGDEAEELLTEIVEGSAECVEAESIELVNDFSAVGAARGGIAETAGTLDVFGETLLESERIGIGRMGEAKLVEELL